jgi:dTMP kinase
MRGIFITIDGPGAVGKSTTSAALADHLARTGNRVHRTAEPSTRPIGAFTRSIADHVHGHALACLITADRYDHLTSEIRPALAAGAAVVCDRYLASTLVLQRLDGVPAEFILSLNSAIDPPDLAVILTANPDLIRRRLAERGARHRFERDPNVSAQEVSLYQEAAAVLGGMGIPVLIVDTGQITPSGAASRIAAELATSTGSLTGHG